MAGNPNNTDACLATCDEASCGDGFVWDGVEDCDDANANNYNDGCVETCEFPSCGDGFEQVNEDCDLGEDNGENAGCLPDCEDNICGDGFVWEDVEQCDDANNVSLDGCENNCERTEIHSLQSGSDFRCILFGAGKVRCWGRNFYGQLGLSNGGQGNIGDAPGEMPPEDVQLGGPVAQLAVGYKHSCALMESGDVRCWGGNSSGQLGIGNEEDIGDDPNEMPPLPVNDFDNVIQVATTSNATFVLLENGRVHCWGSGTCGLETSQAFGDDPNELPTPMLSLGASITELYSGPGSHICARSTQDELICWSSNSEGQLGHEDDNLSVGNTIGEMPPPATDIGNGELVTVHMGFKHTCAQYADGDLRCWGYNSSGQLGLGHTTSLGDDPNEMPPSNAGVNAPVLTASAGLDHTCAVILGGNIRCWGSNEFGQLGYITDGNNIGDQQNEMPPDNALIQLGAVALSASAESTCALYEDNAIRCWGSNFSGVLGNGSVSMPMIWP